MITFSNLTNFSHFHVLYQEECRVPVITHIFRSGSCRKVDSLKHNNKSSFGHKWRLLVKCQINVGITKNVWSVYAACFLRRYAHGLIWASGPEVCLLVCSLNVDQDQICWWFVSLYRRHFTCFMENWTTMLLEKPFSELFFCSKVDG